MPIYRNGKEQKVYLGTKEIDKAYKGSALQYELATAPPKATQTISTLNTIWEVDSGLSRSGDEIVSWTSDTGLVLVPSVSTSLPYFDADEFGPLAGINFNGPSSRSLYISQADLDPDTTALELVQAYTVYIVLKMTASSRSSKAFDGLDSSGRGLLGYNNAQNKMQAYAGSSQYFGSAEVGTRKVYAVEFNGANSKVYRDNNATAVMAGDLNTQPLRGLRVGNAQGNAENFEGVIAAIRVKAGIDASYRNAEMARLVSKYLA